MNSLEVLMSGAGAFTENFRSALNGFNRVDVVQFIQRQTVEHEKAMRLLREENARLKQSAAAGGGDSEGLRANNARLMQQLAECEKQLEQARRENAALREEKQALEEEKDALEVELAQREAEEEEREPQKTLDRPMTAPGGVAVAPSGFNEMELAAYRRAELAERMARERAVAASERMNNIFTQADEKLTLTANDMQRVLEDLQTGYTRLQAMMEDARNILAESSDGIKASAELSGLV